MSPCIKSYHPLFRVISPSAATEGLHTNISRDQFFTSSTSFLIRHHWNFSIPVQISRRPSFGLKTQIFLGVSGRSWSGRGRFRHHYTSHKNSGGHHKHLSTTSATPAAKITNVAYWRARLTAEISYTTIWDAYRQRRFCANITIVAPEAVAELADVSNFRQRTLILNSSQAFPNLTWNLGCLVQWNFP